MRAATYQGAGKPLKLENLPDPVPGEGELVIRIDRCGICGTDIHFTSDEGYQYNLGQTPGHEYAGVVHSVGANVEGFKAGDRISPMPLRGCAKCDWCRKGMPQFCDERALNGGGFAELALVSAASCIHLPPGLSMDDAALIEPMAVGYHAVKISGMEPGAKVLVLGAGPIGLAATFWAKYMGAGRVAVAAKSRTREHYAMSMGADVFVDPDKPIADAAIEALGSKPDIILEALGIPGALAMAIDLVRPQGTISAMGYCSDPDSFVPAVAVDKEVRLQFSETYTLEEYAEVARVLTENSTPRLIVSKTLGLSELPEFFQTMHEKNSYAKVIIDTTR
jgi:(R,R)-butanediol dehydrogenase/meso-butanediol dehydrogenase/diacetyl reductase